VNTLKPVRLLHNVNAKVDERTRCIVEMLAEKENLSLGEATRELLNAGIKARGLMAGVEAL